MFKKLSILLNCRLLDTHIPHNEITVYRNKAHSRCERCNQKIVKTLFDEHWRLDNDKRTY